MINDPRAVRRIDLPLDAALEDQLPPEEIDAACDPLLVAHEHLLAALNMLREVGRRDRRAIDTLDEHSVSADLRRITRVVRVTFKARKVRAERLAGEVR